MRSPTQLLDVSAAVRVSSTPPGCTKLCTFDEVLSHPHETDLAPMFGLAPGSLAY